MMNAQRTLELDQQIAAFGGLIENTAIGLDAVHIRALQEWQAEAQAERAQVADVGLCDENVMAVLPDLVPTIETLRALLIKLIGGGLGTHDMGTIDDAIARSGHLLRRARGENMTAAVAVYEASLLEAQGDDDAEYDDDFGRYGCDDDQNIRH